MRFTLDRASAIKLVVWDLDETFWKGTLSNNDSSVEPIKTNIELVKKLTYRGIINAICSKNDKEVVDKVLQDFGISYYFVFNSINWEPKGVRLQSLISSMALRPANVLFLDDNPHNLAEAEYLMHDILVSDSSITKELYDICDTLGKEDRSLSRLNNYKVLEKKSVDVGKYGTNEEFLHNSNILIQFSIIDEAKIPRIVELIQRSNQLNFTKMRIGEEELRNLMDDDQFNTGCVSVSDNYGKYGIVGFYALNKSSNTLEHFLFSCRIIGMGIEQYVYAHLGFPILRIVEPVLGVVSKEGGTPNYITQVEDLELAKDSNKAYSKSVSILLKGPCDLESMASYIEGKEIELDIESNFVDSYGNQADYYNHSVNILNDNKELIKSWCDRYSFLSDEGFDSNVFSGKYDVICLSLLMDATLAIYKNKQGYYFAYGLYSKPMSDLRFHTDYIQKEVMTARCNFHKDDLVKFSEEFQLVEHTDTIIMENIQQIVRRIKEKNHSTKIVLILLGEKEYISDTLDYYENFPEKHYIHKRINNKIREMFYENDDVHLLDVNKYIKNQSDYFDNINHYSKLVYYQMAKELVDYIKSTCNTYISISKNTDIT